ncbi:ATP-binding protein [Luteolibacter sp. LG18]|uniref:ATP-binding protein n=1 Tax=Luteolibacter sp. LG18 TaxID=2819286 RepID=UPI0030C67FB2
MLVIVCCRATAGGLHPEFQVGDWIWTDAMKSRQECRFVRFIDVPAGHQVKSALLRITADNFYRVYLDGHFIGQGSDWRALTEYDITRLLSEGRHVLAVSVVNDFDFAGLVAGLRIALDNGERIEIATDPAWQIVPDDASSWPLPEPGVPWKMARVVRRFETWWLRPRVYEAPVSLPEPQSFWQKRWFQASLIVVSSAAVLGGLFLAAQLFLKMQAERVVRRERARIATDLHDNLGGGLTQLVLLGEAVRRDLGETAGASGDKLKRLCEQARLMGRNMKETVWLINSQRDTVAELASYLVHYGETFFRDSPIRCRFSIDDDLPDGICGLGVRRNLLLGVKEAFNNVLRHSRADEVELFIERRRGALRVAVSDNGVGFDLESGQRGEGLRNLELRAREAGGDLTLLTTPGEGTLVEFLIPLSPQPRLGG